MASLPESPRPARALKLWEHMLPPKSAERGDGWRTDASSSIGDSYDAQGVSTATLDVEPVP
ncbi:hypothetical protein [Sorangium sp. So ce1151]|uniref:hypothetical protein n=1 Tax=Sorangium sp. So ce1151 TaxID=3133332 RepID=UPI003F5E9129